MDSNSPCKDLLFSRAPNLAQKLLYLVSTILTCFERSIKYKNGCLDHTSIILFSSLKTKPLMLCFSSNRKNMLLEIGRSCKAACFNYDTSAIVLIKQLKPCQTKLFEKYSWHFRKKFIIRISFKNQRTRVTFKLNSKIFMFLIKNGLHVLDCHYNL